MNERLYRSRDDRVIAGVAGGVADYFGIDPAIVRIAWAILVIFSGGLLFLLYVIMWIVVPEEPYDWTAASASQGTAAPPPGPGPSATPPPGEPAAGGGPAAGAAAFAEPATTATSAAGAGESEIAPLAQEATVETAGSEPLGEAAPAEPAGAWAAPTATAWSAQPPPPPSDPRAARRADRAARRAERRADRDPSGAIIFGLILVLIGAFFLVQMYVPDLDAGRFWPIVLVVVGLALLVAALRPRSGPPPAV